jgi:hypothetical protein
MATQVAQKLVALLLMVLCPSAILMAELPSAMLQANGTVLVNGTRTPELVSVFTGDLINTSDASVGSISRSGSSLVVDPNSSIRYQKDGFAILRGKVRVQTSRGMTGHAGPISVIPVADTALFEISSDGKTALVASRVGALTLTDGVETAILEPGYTAKINLDVSQDQDQTPKPAATAKGGGTKKRPPGFLFWIVLSAATGLAIACALECGGGGAAPVSPVMP